MLYAKLFFYHPALLCHSILLGKTTLPLFTPWGGDWFYIYIYIYTYFFFQESLLSSFIALSIHAFGRGWMFYAKLFFYHPTLPCHSILLGKTTLPLFILLGGDWFYKKIYIFFLSRISPIILHCSVNPCFWEGVDVACQTFLLSSYIALSFHTTREELFNHSTLIHSFGRGLILYIYIYLFIYLFIFQEYLLSSFIALSIHAFGRGWVLHVKVFFYHPALLCLPYY